MNFLKLITLNLVMGPKALYLYMYLVIWKKIYKKKKINLNLYIVYGFDWYMFLRKILLY